jgi:hypothetical protein
MTDLVLGRAKHRAIGENRLDADDRRAIDGFDRADPQSGSGDLAHGYAM